MNLLRKNNGLSSTLWNDFFDTELFPTSTINRESSPSVNIKSLSDLYLIEFALPGINKEDIEIDLDDNMLIVSGENKQENVKEEEYTLKEFSYQRFKRSFQLPDNVNPKNSQNFSPIGLTIYKKLTTIYLWFFAISLC